MTGWDRAAYALVASAIVIGANAINEAREHELVTGGLFALVALTLLGLWRLLRWYENRP